MLRVIVQENVKFDADPKKLILRTSDHERWSMNFDRKSEFDSGTGCEVKTGFDCKKDNLLVCEKKPWWASKRIFVLANIFGLSPLIRKKLAVTAD